MSCGVGQQLLAWGPPRAESMALKRPKKEDACSQFPFGASAEESGVVTAATWVAAMAWVRSLAWELLYGMGMVKKKAGGFMLIVEKN